MRKAPQFSEEKYVFFFCFFFFFFFFFLNSVLHPFQDYFSSYGTGQSVGERKRENPEKNHLAHPQAELGLSHMWSVREEKICLFTKVKYTLRRMNLVVCFFFIYQ